MMTTHDLANGKWVLAAGDARWLVRIRHGKVEQIIRCDGIVQQIVGQSRWQPPSELPSRAEVQLLVDHPERLPEADEEITAEVLAVVGEVPPTLLHCAGLAAVLPEQPSVYYARLLPEKTFERCDHENVFETRIRGFTAPVAPSSSLENLRAHGGVEFTEICITCGGRRKVLRNGENYEYGCWQPPGKAADR